jgi:hypothetical protein
MTTTIIMHPLDVASSLVMCWPATCRTAFDVIVLAYHTSYVLVLHGGHIDEFAGHCLHGIRDRWLHKVSEPTARCGCGHDNPIVSYWRQDRANQI